MEVPMLPALTAQYAPVFANSKSGDQVARDAFEEAKRIFKTELTDDSKKRQWLDEQASFEDVRDAVYAAASSYTAKASSTTSKWLARLSARIHIYGEVLDMLVQHHPEYVSLAWAAFKFLFVAVLNHETSAKELAKALTRIADILPQADVDLQLYPTATMRSAVARLYACLLRVAVKALRWFKQRRIGHAVGAILRPWSLEFEDDVNEVRIQLASVTSHANLAARAELRDVHLALRHTEAKVVTAETKLQLIIEQIQKGNEELKALLQVQQGMQQTIMLDLSKQRSAIESVALAQLSGLAFARDFPSPGACLEYCQSFEVRSKVRARYRTMLPNVSELECWSRAPTSSILAFLAQSAIAAKRIVIAMIHTIRVADQISCSSINSNSTDVSTDSVDYPSSGGLTVIWALRFPDHQSVSLTPVTVLRMLVLQVLHRNPGALTRGLSALRPGYLEMAAGEREWLAIFGKALEGLAPPHVFVVLDPDLLWSAMGGSREATSRLLEQIIACAEAHGVVMKVFVPAISVQLPEPGTIESSRWVCAPIEKRRARRLQRVPQGARRQQWHFSGNR